MTQHPFYYERSVAERHTQIQHDMQLSRAYVQSEQATVREIEIKPQALHTQQAPVAEQRQKLRRAS
ncbi:MAG TPA: hypothetical protein VGD98_09110 [Ktedonobacteraceae bacterium]